MIFLRRLYTIYCITVFVLGFFFLFPAFLLIINFKSLRHWTGPINNLWAKVFFKICFIKMDIRYEYEYDRNGQYIFCPNHFSYLDIPIMGFTLNNFIFVGKSEIMKVPVFGYMFRKLHITVDRLNFRDRYSVLDRSLKALDQGHSLVIFPEGGIATKKPPKMVRFKDGAFRTAIEKQIPIIPVTIPFNWIILPDDGRYLMRLRKGALVYHKPIETKGRTMEDIEALKKETYAVIDNELGKYFSHSFNEL